MSQFDKTLYSLMYWALLANILFQRFTTQPFGPPETVFAQLSAELGPSKRLRNKIGGMGRWYRISWREVNRKQLQNLGGNDGKKKKLTTKCNKVQANISWPPGRFQTLLDLSIPWPRKRFAASLSHHLKICFSLCCVILCDFYLKMWRKLHVPDSCSRLYILFKKTNHTGVTSHDFLRQPYVSAFESMLVAVVLTASRGHENPIHRGSCWQRSRPSFFSIFFLRTENKIIPFARQTILFSKVTWKKKGCKGANTNAYSYPCRNTHIS